MVYLSCYHIPWTMSEEILEISVRVEEQFDMKFDLVNGVLGFILKIFGR